MAHLDEEHGIPMLKTFKAILQLEHSKKLPTSSRLAVMLEKRTTTILVLYWRWGYLSRKPVQTVNLKRNVDHCVWYYRITKKGLKKYTQLITEFGDVPLNNSVPLRELDPKILEDRNNSVPPEISAAPSLGDIPFKQVK
jgi:hypothetical protein